MKKEYRETLKLFQCDYNRALEEDFAQVFSERADVRLFFINEDEAFTDGRNIVVDPACNGLFADKAALYNTEEYLCMSHECSNDSWMALRMNTRAQNIHECLHLLYTTFPLQSVNDVRSTTKVRRMVLGLIDNIIEDAFIEAVGCSVYDNLEIFLSFARMLRVFSDIPTQGTVERTFETKDTEHKLLPIVEYLNYMISALLYPMQKELKPSAAIKKYVKKTRTLFFEGARCGEPSERFTFSQRIFDIIAPIIPKNEENIKPCMFEKRLVGIKTHSSEAASIGTFSHAGKSAVITRLLFMSTDGKLLVRTDYKDKSAAIMKGFEKEKQTALSIVTYKGAVTERTGGDYDCTRIHKDIKIIETKPKINLNLKKAYKNIYNKYRININSYTAHFLRLLQGAVEVQEDKFVFGSGIASKRMGDIKKRYWFRKVQGIDVPSIAILLLIDGSGSMEGERRNSAMESAVILHEVLKKRRIEHAIVEHRALYGEPIVKHNILVSFDAREEEKYNIMMLDADDGTREGLTLYWAEKYLRESSYAENKLVIVLSDGVPAHGVDSDACYLPPVSIKDTANAARKIIKRGTDIIAVALDNEDEDSCYAELNEIYPHVVSCTNLKHLTGKLLTLISKRFV